jgi:hypothetical protein
LLYDCTSAFRHIGSRFGAAWASVLLLVPSAGCSPSDPPPPCGPRQPALAIQVTVGGAELPSDTRLRVGYGGIQSESFQLSKPRKNEDVCCQTSVEAVTGELPRVSCSSPANVAADGGRPRAIQCTLWTGGPAKINVNAFGYVPILERELDTRLQENEKCGETTVEYQLDLGRPDDGGV